MVRTRSVVERKAPDLPPYLTVDDRVVAPLQPSGATPIEISIDGVPIGRRMLEYWGDDRNCWFVDLTRKQCAAAGVDVGAEVVVEIARADDSLPDELTTVIESDPRSRAHWDRLTPGRRRQISEAVRAALNGESRARRARRLLDPEA